MPRTAILLNGITRGDACHHCRRHGVLYGGLRRATSFWTAVVWFHHIPRSETRPPGTDGYVIIDDHVDIGASLRHHLVQTHPAQGRRPFDAPRAIAMLMRGGSLVTGSLRVTPYEPSGTG